MKKNTTKNGKTPFIFGTLDEIMTYARSCDNSRIIDYHFKYVPPWKNTPNGWNLDITILNPLNTIEKRYFTTEKRFETIKNQEVV